MTLLGLIKFKSEHKDFTGVLSLVEDYENKYEFTQVILKHKARALMGVGDIRTAYKYLLESVAENKADEELYFLKGLLELDMGKVVLAENSMRVSLMLSDNNIEVLYYLGFILNNYGDKKEAVDKLSLAKDKIDKEEYVTIFTVDGLTIDDLNIMIINELERAKNNE